MQYISDVKGRLRIYLSEYHYVLHFAVVANNTALQQLSRRLPKTVQCDILAVRDNTLSSAMQNGAVKCQLL